MRGGVARNTGPRISLRSIRATGCAALPFLAIHFPRSPIMLTVSPNRARGQRLKAARVARGISQRELARRVGSTQANITAIERGLVENSKFDALILWELAP